MKQCPTVEACRCPLQGEHAPDSADHCMQAQQVEGTWACPCKACPCDCHLIPVCAQWEDHVWVEDYYGTGCAQPRCELWFASGCAPWDVTADE